MDVYISGLRKIPVRALFFKFHISKTVRLEKRRYLSNAVLQYDIDFRYFMILQHTIFTIEVMIAP